MLTIFAKLGTRFRNCQTILWPLPPPACLPYVGTSLFWLRLNHDATLSEAYALFRKQDSVLRLRLLLRRRWGVTVGASSASKSTHKKDAGGELLEMGGCRKGAEGNERNPDRALQTSLKMSKRGTGSEIGETSAVNGTS